MVDKKVYDPLTVPGQKSLRDYTHIRAYHACRTESEDSYRKDGIRLLSYDELLAMTKSHLEQIGIMEERIKTAFDDYWSEYEQNKNQRHVYLNAWKEELLTYSGHYLVYGSEMINAVACTIGGLVYQNTLKRIGKPTLIVCDVPISDIEREDLQYLEEHLPITQDTSIRVKSIKPKDIIRFEYPRKIFDPLQWVNYYYNDT